MSKSVHPKPMRLGTRSCTECRRRKVRCVFPAAHPPCQQCGLRGIPCTTQQLARQGDGSLGSLSSPGEERLKLRLADIERNVRNIWASLSQTSASPSLPNLLPATPSMTPSVVNSVGSELESMLRVGNDIHATTPDGSDMVDDGLRFQDAPLLTLVKAASITEEVHFASLEPSASSSNRTNSAIHLPEPLLLQDDDLLTVLAATETYWPIWPPWQYGTPPPTMRTLQNGGIEFAARFLSHMARSSSPCIAAKALLWLSLCIQQAPKTLHLSQCRLSHEALLASYMQTADSLLASAARTGETLHGIEARLIQQKLYVDMGLPRKAWLSVRRAADAALLLRLHRALDQTGEDGGRREAIWNQIWHLDTTLALILGLPSTIPIRTPSPVSLPQSSRDDGSSGCDSSLRTLQHRMSSVAASVVARNQSLQPSYITTLQIGHELDGCRALMPDSWWHEPPPPGQPFAQLYAEQVTKVQYFLIAKLLHLPFMLSAGYDYSHTSALAASRGLIAAYLGLRSCDSGLFVVCESLEFQAFSAGTTLMIHLLSPTSGARPGNDDNSGEDWPLIEALTLALQRTANMMRCNVARQAAEVLGLLTQAARGAYHGPDRYDVVLPYFGKITIALSRGRKTADLEGRGENCQQRPATPPDGTVEFRANPFDLSHFSGSLEGELGGDWSFMTDVDIGFDWTQIYTFGNNNNGNLP